MQQNRQQCHCSKALENFYKPFERTMNSWYYLLIRLQLGTVIDHYVICKYRNNFG
jgi:hypothetical protein